jgi:hypothetical protein
VAVNSATTAVSSGPATRIGLRPTRSTSQPVGTVPSAQPTRNAVTTRLASPNPTSNDLARTGIAGRAIPTPSASSMAGR